MKHCLFLLCSYFTTILLHWFFHTCSTCCHLCFLPEECVHGVTVMSLRTFPNTMSRNVCKFMSFICCSKFILVHAISVFIFCNKENWLKAFLSVFYLLLINALFFLYYLHDIFCIWRRFLALHLYFFYSVLSNCEY